MIYRVIGFFRINFFLICLIFLFLFLFFFKLDYKTLENFDEAWYGSIATEIVKTNDFFNLKFAGQPYYDHPPMGFWLIALSYKVFGINEFSTRFPSALLGLFSIILIYLTAIQLTKNKFIGFGAALILGTSVWYLIRARSGNLDSIFVFFSIATVFFSIKSSKNFLWFPLAMISYGGLIMSKTLVGVIMSCAIIYFNFFQLFKLKNLLLLIIGLFCFYILVIPWYSVQFKTNPNFYQYHFINIGMRNKTGFSLVDFSPTQPLFYLHMGIRKWYYLWIVSIFTLFIRIIYESILGLYKSINKKGIVNKLKTLIEGIKSNQYITSYFFVLLWNGIVLFPYLMAKETQIWHLIPVYLPISIITSIGLFEISALIFNKKIFNRFIVSGVFLLGVIILTIIQIRNFSNEVYEKSKYVNDQADISKRLTKYNQPIYLDDDFYPVATFYSRKPVIWLIGSSNHLLDNQKNLVGFFKSDIKDFVIVTRYWAVANLDAENIPYKILEKNNSFSIVTK